mmetsp:Transcript_17689/g.36012  ORF Transcript_17689/g.36012 Transcript_17689/m.36012 type:complete len:84 (+) Transcript_17689:1158-1409(+)
MGSEGMSRTSYGLSWKDEANEQTMLLWFSVLSVGCILLFFVYDIVNANMTKRHDTNNESDHSGSQKLFSKIILVKNEIDFEYY